MGNILVLASSSQSPYPEEVRILLTSLRVNSPEQVIYLYAYDFLEPQDFVEYNPNVIVFYRDIPLQYKNRVGNYLATVRGELLLNLLQTSGVDKIAWFDTDIIVRKSLASFWDHIEQEKLSIVYRPNLRIEFKVNSGVFGILNSEKIRAFIQKYVTYLSNCDKRWYSDQIYLYKSAKECGISIKHLSSDILSLVFLQQSIIWHSRKTNLKHPVWREECHNYMRLGKENG